MKTLICVPCYERPHLQFIQSLDALKRVGTTAVAYVTSSLVAVARNQLCEKAMAENCDYILWLDSDMVFNSDLMIDLMKDIEENKCDLVSGIAFRKTPPFNPAIYKKIRMGINGENEIEEYNDYPKNQLFEVDSCGFAGCLMSVDMLKEVVKEYHTAFQCIPGFGEDISFCIRAKQKGYKLYCDSRVKLGHLTETVIDEETYLGWNK